MSRLKGNCPSCGAEVAFKIGTSLVTVCEFCHTVVARGDKKVEDLGKVADLVETASPLKLDLKGKHHGKAFRIVGRCQFAHPAGGVWDEWYCAFPGGNWGWLAEAQGKFYLTFQQELPHGLKLPELEKLQVGRKIKLPDVGTFTVAEIGTGTTLGAAGELPFRPEPNETFTFVDLQGADGEFATFDYGLDPAVAYVGREVTLDDIGIDKKALAPEKEATQVAAIGVSCPQCAGSLELRAPDQAQRVVCPYCNSLLDTEQGTLKYLQTLEQPKRQIFIPLGSKGTLDGIEYTVLGFVTRSVNFEGIDYYWDEYLLYQPREGFRWLVHSDDNWSFVRPLSIGEVNTDPYHKLIWKGKTFKLYQRAMAEVRYVAGEFYWKVTLHERVSATDYICPPEMISLEETVSIFEGEVAGEITCSLGTYLPPEAVEKAFGVTDLPRPSKVAPNQPYPYKSIYRDSALFVAALFVIGICFIAGTRPREAYRHAFTILPAAMAANPAAVAAAKPPAGGLPGQPAIPATAQPQGIKLPVIAGQPVPGQPVPGQPAPVQPAPAQSAVPVPAAGAPPAQAVVPGAPAAAQPPAEANTFFSETPIELHSRQVVTISMLSNVNQTWVELDGHLFNEETGDVQPFSVYSEFYSGVEDGESWSEGTRNPSTVVSALPSGKYTLRLEGFTGSTKPETVTVAIEEGNFRILNLFLALLALLSVPTCVLLHHWSFDRSRWADSDYSPYASKSEE